MEKYLISKEEFLNQLINQIEYTGVLFNESDIDDNGNIYFKELDYDYKHLVLNYVQQDLIKLHNINIDEFCRDNEINFVSEIDDFEMDFIHVTKKSNLESIKQLGLIVDQESNFIPDLGVGIYAIPIGSEKGLDNLKTFLEDYCEDEILLITGTHKGKYTHCIKGEGHEGYIVFKDPQISPENLSFETMNIYDFLMMDAEEFFLEY